MSNTNNMNQANNFWDFVASLQNNPGAFPFAEGRGPSAEFDPFEGQQFWGPWAQRGRGRGPHGHGPHGHGRRGPPPPAGEGHESHGPSGNESDGPAPPRGPGPHAHHHHGPRGPHAHPHGPPHHHGRGGHRGPPPPEHDGAMPPPPPPFDEPLSRSPTPPTPPETPAEPHHHPRSQSPRHHRGPSPHHHGPRHHRGPSPHGRRGRGFHGRGGHHNHPRGGNNGPAFPFDLSALAEAFAPGIFGGHAFGEASANAREQNTNISTNNNNSDGTFTPSVDLFSTPTAYVLHTSLPGAKKPEIDVTYSAARNSITISGVVTRPDVSETMMNCLVTDERREVGMFEREVRLEEGVKVADENISAKLEDGILRVVIPKVIQEEEEGWESVRKVELE
ncbi:hypothetical protein D6C79_02610 [Aureobasidium pullulans]|nr:hypothetical protein D6C79_02610 [Aureobasidium pullulans]